VKCLSERIHFRLIIYKQFNFCRFRASFYTNVDRLCAVSLYSTLCRRLQIGCKIDSPVFLFLNCTWFHVAILLVHVVLRIQLVTHCMTLHLEALNFKIHFCDQLARLSKSFCNDSLSEFYTIVWYHQQTSSCCLQSI